MSLESRRLQAEGIKYFVQMVCRHETVLDIEILNQDNYKAIVNILRRPGFANIKAYVADVYTLTISDVMTVLLSHPDINSIIVISNWNHYTQKAKQEAIRQGVGVFTLTQFWGALNYRGWRDFLATGDANDFES